MAGPGLGSKNKQKLGNNGSTLLKGAGTKQPAKQLGGIGSRGIVLPGVTVKMKSLYNLNNPFDMLAVARYRQQEWNPQGMAVIDNAFRNGGRDAVVVISLPLLSIFVAEGGAVAVGIAARQAATASAQAAKQVYLSPQAAALKKFVLRQVISGVNKKLAASKLILSLSSQYAGAVGNGETFTLSSIDYMDIAADQVMHPLAGAAVSSAFNVNVGLDNGITVNTSSLDAIVVGTLTGWGSNRLEGLLDNVVMKNTIKKVAANIANVLLQTVQKNTTSIITPRLIKAVDQLKPTVIRTVTDLFPNSPEITSKQNPLKVK